jgi:hypothetical protein
MVALLDNLGIWNNIGSIFPSGDWQSYPLTADQGLSIFRLTWGGDLSDVKSYVYIRQIYIKPGFAEPDSRWRKAYPKQGSEILFIPLPEELQALGISRGFQVIKWYRYLRTGINIDSAYSLNIQEFQPLPEFEEVFKVLKFSDLQAVRTGIVRAIEELNDIETARDLAIIKNQLSQNAALRALGNSLSTITLGESLAVEPALQTGTSALNPLLLL